MNDIVKDILEKVEEIKYAAEISDEVLQHVGVGAKDNPPGRGSGRYPLGSGEKPYQHANAFLTKIEELKAQGYTEKQIAEYMKLDSTTKLRVQRQIAGRERRTELVERAKTLCREGKTLKEIADIMGYPNDSSVRSLLNENAEARMKAAQVTADFLKNMVDEKGMIQVGEGANLELGELGLEISPTKLAEALYMLELEGYPTWRGRVAQATNPGRMTTLTVLCPPGTENKDIYEYENIHSILDYEKRLTEDGTKVRGSFEPPTSLDSKRLAIRYAEDGGEEKDGIIEIRRGMNDINLGNSNYAQIRMMVDGTHYLKGMAVYSDDLPDGVDVLFNTNKHKDKTMFEVLKKAKEKADGTLDEENPFGALLKQEGGQMYYDDPKGKYTDPVTGKKQSLSPLNKTREEGDWHEWADTLASQFLAKQPLYLINRQLDLSKADKRAELEDIMELNNPVVKKQLLIDFADDCDSTAVHLKAAALPRQKYQVILPLTTLKEGEIYAPNYNDGEMVALVRYPHGGIYEIPILRVNNKNKEGRSVITENAKDAVGIRKEDADRLSGADFDGDTVMVIPTNSKIRIQNRDQLKGLVGFDPKMEYGYDDVKVNSKGEEEYYRGGKKFKAMKNTQNEMGRVSNLIMDMTLMGAKDDELARAVRHSMVVIDAEKHHLDYKQSEIDNNIKELKEKYQPKDPVTGRGGAATLLTRAKSDETVDKRRGNAKINDDGTLRWDTAYDLYYTEKKKIKVKDEKGRLVRDEKGNPTFEVNEDGKPVWVETGKTKKRTQRSTRMAETDDARTLISFMDTPQERAYADYANTMKALANEARKAYKTTPNLVYNAEAAKKYASEVNSLNAQLRLAELNKPKERQAQTITAAVMKQRKKENPSMTAEQERKENQKALSAARIQVGAQREPVKISDKEWEAIQAGAITHTKLTQILKQSDKERLRELATPRQTKELSEAKINKIQRMKDSGFTNAEIAKAVGVSSSTVTKYL